MPSDIEKQSFLGRLRAALDHATKVRGATDLAREFNLQHRDGEDVSAQSAHQCLSGEETPTTYKLATLARWLGISENWRHYGPPPDAEKSGALTERNAGGDPRCAESVALVRKIEALSLRHRLFVEEIVMQFHCLATKSGGVDESRAGRKGEAWVTANQYDVRGITRRGGGVFQRSFRPRRQKNSPA